MNRKRDYLVLGFGLATLVLASAVAINLPNGSAPTVKIQEVAASSTKSLTWQEARSSINSKTATDLQKSHSRSKYIGTRVTWHGEVGAVEGALFGLLDVLIYPEGDTLGSFDDFFVAYYPEKYFEELLNLNLGDQVEVTCTIEGIAHSGWFKLNDCVLPRKL